jgi:hypothetical protein
LLIDWFAQLPTHFKSEVFMTKRLVVTLTVGLIWATVVLFFLCGGSKAHAGAYVFETQLSYKCDNTDPDNSYMRCYQDGQKVIVVTKTPKNNKMAKYQDYLVAVILTKFKAAGGVSFKLVKDDEIDYKGCSFIQKSFAFSCTQRKLSKAISF